MKKLCYSAVVAFCSSVATIMALHVLAEPNNPASETTEVRAYTLEEVAKHNTQQDCWMVIEGKVYDLSAYMPKHPTPPTVLVPWCGKEATQGMRTKGYGNDHSQFAWGMLPEYLIGDYITP